jgi:hypothetical protein
MSDRRYLREQNQIKRTHPMWKPIGFLLMVFVPFFSFGLADIAMKWIIENVEDFSLPPILESDPINIWGDWIVYNLPGTILITVIITIVLFLILALFNSIIYSANSDRNLSALHVPEERRKKKKKNLRDI